MFIYFIILLFIAFGVFHYDIRNKTFYRKTYAVFLSVLITLMIGLRYKVGGDALTYEYYFRWMPNLSEYLKFLDYDRSFNYQPLYLLFVAICKTIDPSYYVYQFIHAVVVNSIITWFLYKYCEKFFTALFLLFVLCLYFYFTFEIQREILAICCFLLGFKYYQNNKWIPYAILAVIAFFIHISAIILFVLPFFKLVKLRNQTVLLILVIALGLSFLKSFFYDAISVFLVTDTMTDKGKVYNEMEFSISGLFFFFLGRVGLLLPIVFYYVRNKEEPLRDIVTAFYILSCLSQVMVGFDRMLNYVTIPFIICFCNFLYSKNIFKIKIKKKLIALSTYFCLFFFICIKIVMDLNVTDRARYHSIFFPYSSHFDKEKNPERERFMIELWTR